MNDHSPVAEGCFLAHLVIEVNGWVRVGPVVIYLVWTFLGPWRRNSGGEISISWFFRVLMAVYVAKGYRMGTVMSGGSHF